MLLHNGFTVVLRVVQERFGRSITLTSNSHASQYCDSTFMQSTWSSIAFLQYNNMTLNLNPTLI